MKIILSEESIDIKSSNGVYKYKKEIQNNIIKVSNKSIDINSSTGIYLYKKIGE